MAFIYFDGSNGNEVTNCKSFNDDPRGIYFGPYGGWDEEERVLREINEYLEAMEKGKRTFLEKLRHWWRSI